MANNIVTLENITKVFTERAVFDGTDFFLQEGEKVGVVGINGTGKSTLLKVIAGLEEVDSGKRVLANHLVIKYLAQHPEYNADDNIIECIVRESGHGRDLSKEKIVDIETKAKTMLTRLGIYEFDQKVGTLSGGQQKRLALVEALLSDADVLLLDEPTNHLDQMMTTWLEEMLKKSRKTIVMVTHDRYFLDLVCKRIVEVDKGKIYSYEANYSGFLALKAEREEMEFASDRKLRSLLRTELEWVKRGARARTTKQKFRLNRYEELKDTKAPETDGKVELGSIATRMGRTTIELENISKSFDDVKYIDDFSYVFLKNDRIGIIGRNGCGKTTLLNIIAGRIEPDFGQITVGQTIKIGYYSQMIEEAEAKMDPNQKVIDYIKDTAEYVQTDEGPVSASRMLEKFLFIKSQQYMPLGKLSGGEKRRLNLLRVLMEAPNVLILDEPTNDLDITTLNVLEDFLDSFKGIVIIVSHDRYFLDRTVNRLFAFEYGENGAFGGALTKVNCTIRQFEGSYTDYELSLDNEGRGLNGSSANGDRFELNSGNNSNGDRFDIKFGKSREEKQSSKEEWKRQNQANKKLKFTFQEKKDYETIEADIAELEMRIETIEADMVKFSRDFPKLNELTKEKNEIQLRLDEKMERWMYLEELAEKIKNEG